MTDDGTITNKVLFDHIQLGRKETRELKKDLVRLEKKVDEGFEHARVHREAIEEDLKATIQMQFRHEKELAVLTGRPMPEDY